MSASEATAQMKSRLRRPAMFRTRQTEKRFLELYRSDTAYCVHNVAAAFILRTPINERQLEGVLAHVGATHTMLCARFEVSGEDWWLHTRSRPIVQHVQLAHSPQADEQWRAAIVSHGTKQARRPHFPDLVHITLLSRNADESAVIVTLNHSVTDLAGLVQLCNEFARALAAVVDGVPLHPEPPQYSIGACADDEFHYVHSPRGQANLQWWARSLADYEPDPRLREPHGGARTIRQELARATVERIKGRAACAGVTPAMLLLARYFQALGTITDSSDILVSSITSRRGLVPGDHALVGCLVDFLLFRIRDLEASTTEELAQELITQTVVSTQRWLPYWLLVRELAPSFYDNTCGITGNEYNFIPERSQQIAQHEGVEIMPISVQREWLTFRRGVMVMAKPTAWPLFVTFDPKFVGADEATQLAYMMVDWS